MSASPSRGPILTLRSARWGRRLLRQVFPLRYGGGAARHPLPAALEMPMGRSTARCLCNSLDFRCCVQLERHDAHDLF